MHTKFRLERHPGSGYGNSGRSERGWSVGEYAGMVLRPFTIHKAWNLTAKLTAPSTLQIKDAVGNEYGKAKDIVGETRLAFTSRADTAFDVCLDNTLVSRRMFYPSNALQVPSCGRCTDNTPFRHFNESLPTH
jgi:hypothetical protein